MGMTIDKAKSVINELKLYVEDLHSYSADDVAEALEMSIKALEQKSYKSEARRWKRRYLDLKQRTKWISVSERLPKAGEYIGDVAKYYLVQNEYGDMLVARYTHSEYWEQMYQLKPIADEIVAWMPLPQPYNAESEVNADDD